MHMKHVLSSCLTILTFIIMESSSSALPRPFPLGVTLSSKGSSLTTITSSSPSGLENVALAAAAVDDDDEGAHLEN